VQCSRRPARGHGPIAFSGDNTGLRATRLDRSSLVSSRRRPATSRWRMQRRHTSNDWWCDRSRSRRTAVPTTASSRCRLSGHGDGDHAGGETGVVILSPDTLPRGGATRTSGHRTRQQIPIRPRLIMAGRPTGHRCADHALQRVSERGSQLDCIYREPRSPSRDLHQHDGGLRSSAPLDVSRGRRPTTGRPA